MITTIAPLVLDSVASGAGAGARAHVTTVAAPIWDIGAEIKNRGITFSVWMLMGGTAVTSTLLFLVSKNKTAALKVLGVGIFLIGLVSQLPSLGVVSKDTVGGMTHTGTR